MALKCKQDNLHYIKVKFKECLKRYCPDMVIDDDNRDVFTNISDWLIRNKNGVYDPTKGLWICGNIGTGKSTLMKAVLWFIHCYWRLDCGTTLNPKWENVPEFCGKYAVSGFSVFETIPMGLDELGTEIFPTNHSGNKLNVVAHILNVIYDRNTDLPYIVTTNRSMKAILDNYGPRSVDRVGQLFNIVELNGKTRRPSTEVWNMIKAEENGNQEAK